MKSCSRRSVGEQPGRIGFESPPPSRRAAYPGSCVFEVLTSRYLSCLGRKPGHNGRAIPGYPIRIYPAVTCSRPAHLAKAAPPIPRRSRFVQSARSFGSQSPCTDAIRLTVSLVECGRHSRFRHHLPEPGLCFVIARAFGQHRFPQPSHFGMIATLSGQDCQVCVGSDGRKCSDRRCKTDRDV